MNDRQRVRNASITGGGAAIIMMLVINAIIQIAAYAGDRYRARRAANRQE